MSRDSIVVSALIALVSSSISAEDIPLSRGLQAGPNAVGFRVVRRFDTSRDFKRAIDVDGSPTLGERARTMQIGIWYPAEKPSSGNPMHYRDYLNRAPFDLSEPDGSDRGTESVLGWLGMSPTHEAVKRTLATRTAAYWEAPAEEGQRPVVIYAPSNEGPLYENSVMCEYLASHGFIVIASPCIGARSRETTPPSYPDVDGQARDIEYLIGFAREVPQAHWAEVAVAGFSIGGLANFLAALRSDQVAALVVLDGTIVGLYPQIKTQPYVSGVPQLELPAFFALSSEKLMARHAFYVPGSRAKFIDEIPHIDVCWAEFPRLVHQNFSSLFNHLWKRPATEGEASDEVALEDYSVVCQYVHHFLRVHLLKDAQSRRFLDATVKQNGFNEEAVTIRRRPPIASPATTLGFARRVREDGYDKILETYQAIRSKDPNFSLTEPEINRWAFQLLARAKTNEAIAAFRLNLHLYPTSNNAYNGLGETYAKMGDHQRSEEQYRKSVEVNPDSDAGKQAKKQLEK